MKKVNVLETLIAGIDSGKDVSRRRLFRAIGATALAKMEREWSKEVRSRSYRPPEIVEYSRQLGIALRKYGKADYHSLKKSSKARRLFHSAETCFERAMEYLMDKVSAKSELRYWLDRDVNINSPDFGFHPEGMPYPIWSKSPYARGKGFPKRTIRDLKRDALLDALEQLEKLSGKKPEPLADPPVFLRSRGCKTLQLSDLSDWKFDQESDLNPNIDIESFYEQITEIS
jgi:hypothetical protein